LIVTGDDVLLDDLLALVAVSGREPRVVPEAAMAGSAWAAAPLALVGADALPARAPLRRPGVLIVGRGATDSDLWREAVRLGAEDVLDTTRDAVALRARIEASTGAIGAPVLAVAGGLGVTTLASVLAVGPSTAGPGDCSSIWRPTAADWISRWVRRMRPELAGPISIRSRASSIRRLCSGPCRASTNSSC
jgi:hypothetical protein